MKVAVLQEHLADGACIAITQEGVLDNDTRTTASLQHLDEVLHKHIGCLGSANLKVLQHLATLIATKGRISKNHILAIALLNLAEVHCQRVSMRDIGGRYTVKYHVHRGDDIGQTFLLLAIEGRFLQDFMVLHTLYFVLHVEERLTKEARRTASGVIDRFTDFGVNHLDDAANQWTWCVILTAISSCITHALDIALIEHSHFMLILSTLEVEFINHVDDLTHIESGADLVVQFAKDLAYLIFKAIRLSSSILEVFEVREELLVNKFHQVVTTHSVDSIQYHLSRLRVALLWCSPLAPTIET